jgi:hypothetical protein
MHSATYNPGPNRERLRHRLSIALACVSCAAAVTGCASASSPSSASGTGSNDTLALKFAQCMRAHGVPNFPDPGRPAADQPGINQQAPAFQSSEQQCDKLTNNPEPKRSPASKSQRLAALAESECMRKHGVPNFPDPTFLSSGGSSVNLNGLNPQSPAFKQAQAACPLGPRAGRGSR